MSTAPAQYTFQEQQRPWIGLTENVEDLDVTLPAPSPDLLIRVKTRLPQLEELLARIEDRSGEEDGVYRFYHQSLKAFELQELTLAGLKLIEEIGGETDPPHPWYCRIDLQRFSWLGSFRLRQRRQIVECLFVWPLFARIALRVARPLRT
jgi:hypothetical protein